MSHPRIATTLFALLVACGGAEPASEPRDQERAAAPARPDGNGDPSRTLPEDISADPEASPAAGGDTDTAGAAGDAVGEPLPSGLEGYVTFVDPASGFSTADVHDADRQIIHFDAERQALIWSTSGDAVSGWSTRGSDLSWNRSGVAFRVRFGTEAGERRAYFTETDRGTICNLTLTGPETLGISPTGETPPLE